MMAPITRASLRAPPSIVREGSWQFPVANEDSEQDLASSEAESEDNDHLIGDEGVLDMASPTSRLSARRDLVDLQQTADRVVKQVEEFARNLDKFIVSNKEASPEDLWDDAHALLKAFQKNANRRVEASRNSRSSSRNRSSLSSSGPPQKSNPLQDQQEADVWELLAALLAIDNPQHQKQIAAAQSNAFRGLNRYSSDLERWESFVRADVFAQEALAVITWLQRTAEASSLPIEEITQELRGRSERGDGIWASGWLYTKETIKGQKRLRSWSQYIEPKERREAHITRPDGATIVSQLDPDATLRQNHTLIDEDLCHEAAAWMTCWQMIRRGRSWADVKDHWDQRNEHWRACSVLGAPVPSEENNSDHSLAWIRACRSEEPWSIAARLLSEDPRALHFEAAVYGLLGGNKYRSLQVCETADDNLFVAFISLLQERYDNYCRELAQRLQPTAQKAGPRYYTAPPKKTYGQLQEVLSTMLAQGKLKLSSQDMLKIIQAFMMTKNIQKFLTSSGRSSSREQRPNGQKQTSDWSITGSEDREALRTAVHIQIVMDRLGYMKGVSAEDYNMMQQNVSAYIRQLRDLGLLQLAPLYASCMPRNMATKTLGEVLIQMTDDRERDLVVSLMKKYGITFIKVLSEMFRLAAPDNNKVTQFNSVQVVQNHSRIPRKLQVRTDFMNQELASVYTDLVHCLEWFRWVDLDSWNLCCEYTTSYLAKFIFEGQLCAALVLVQDASVRDLSKAILNTDITLGDSSPETSDNDPPSAPISHAVNGRSKTVTALDNLADQLSRKKQAQTWQELEQLVLTLQSFQEWANLAAEADPEMNGSRAFTAHRHSLRKSLSLIDTQARTLLDPDFLTLPPTPALAPTLSAIRTHYVPQVLLAWLSALEFAGYNLSRDYLGEAMNVAVLIASTEGLAETVQRAGRMGELVRMLAVVGKSVLEGNENQGDGGKKKRKGEVNLGIWEVSGSEVGLEREMGGLD